MSQQSNGFSPPATGRPVVVAIDMGYGHLRPAYAIAQQLGVPVYHADRPPLAGPDEARIWHWIRRYYEGLSRATAWPGIGPAIRSAFNAATGIASLYPERDLSRPNLATRALERVLRRGLGAPLADELQRRGAPLVTTFYMPAVAAARLGCEPVYCVVTDCDINRVWAPYDASSARITYLVPTQDTRRRLRAYGVPNDRVRVTGFPLPHELVGGTELTSLKRNLARRLVRLDPNRTFRKDERHGIQLFLGDLPRSEEGEPVRLTFAVGGAGAQVGLARQFLPSLRELIAERRLTVALVAGVRPDVAVALERAVVEAGLQRHLHPGGAVQILLHERFEDYLSAFNALLAETDVLWTKPSEITFFAALGLPLIFSWPVGTHERHNRRWAVEAGAGLKQRDPRYAAEWLRDWLKDGTLAGAAWAGFTRLPHFGLYQILEVMGLSPQPVESNERAAAL